VAIELPVTTLAAVASAEAITVQGSW
jgi:hypothetical protein